MELPEPLARAFPELAPVDLSEPMAPCSRCVMAPGPADPPDRPVFTAPARCCTYHPELANWQVGLALLAGGPGAAAIHRRLLIADGVGPLGIRPTAAAQQRYEARDALTFGRDSSLTCPYWVEGPLGCSVHDYRNGVCRTWTCRTTHGARGMAAWIAVRDLLRAAEVDVAERVAEVPADGDWASAYIRCAERALAMPAEGLRTPRLDALLARVTRRLVQRDRPLPLCPTPAIRAWTVRADGVELESWSPYDRVTAPPWIFQLLARLNGTTPWPDAVRATEAAIGEPVPADLVARLWWRGLLAEPEADEGGALEIIPR